MTDLTPIDTTRDDYALLEKQAASVMSGERDAIANAANVAALLYRTLPDINWAGFYFVRGDDLVLGPFQGAVACTRIGFGRGVCGHAWRERRTIVVPDVHAFDGHIACDPQSQSEIVVPIVTSHGTVAGVLDVDSPRIDRFGAADRALLEAIVADFVRSSALDGT
jgi:GAF domain-containing protein